MKLRWNILYLITLSFGFVAYLSWQGNLPGELLGGLAGGLVTLVAAVARELIENKPSPSERVAELFGEGGGPNVVVRCPHFDDTPKAEQEG